ncbi:MAG: hypothetical protein E7642_02675 [Ruminococcaceae bacterium]|nr:hypothetical protein [Oscillospiraceae bacterium]
MEYEKIILELLMRVKTLEERVEELSNQSSVPAKKQPGTADIREYIEAQKNIAKEKGFSFLVLKANDIHKEMNLKSRMPAVCNAMKQCMNPGDIIVHETASGFSSTYEIKYRI